MQKFTFRWFLASSTVKTVEKLSKLHISFNTRPKLIKMSLKFLEKFLGLLRSWNLYFQMILGSCQLSKLWENCQNSTYLLTLHQNRKFELEFLGEVCRFSKEWKNLLSYHIWQSSTVKTVGKLSKLQFSLNTRRKSIKMSLKFSEKFAFFLEVQKCTFTRFLKAVNCQNSRETVKTSFLP